MDFSKEFEPVELILDSKCITKGVDAFALSLIKAERQIRKLFTFLVYQNPNLNGQFKELREALAENRNVFFLGFIKGIEIIYPVKLKDLIGEEHDQLEKNLLNAISIRNKIFHGQITDKFLSTEDLILITDGIKKWCAQLAISASSEFGYDGFGRNSMRKSEKDIYPRYLVKIESIDGYREFIRKYMVLERKPAEAEIRKSNLPYYQINKREILRGFQFCLENASSQFNSAIKIEGENLNAGLANSIMILSGEECIKALVLLSIYLDVQVPFAIKPIFKRHDAKHIRGKELNDFVRKLSLSLGAFSSKRSEQVKSIIGLVFEAIAGDDTVEIDWWDAANDVKNDGLYVAYVRGQFESPTDLAEKSFKTSTAIVTRFISLLSKASKLMKDSPS